MRALAPFHGRILWRDCVRNMLTLSFCIDLVYFEVEGHTISNMVCSRSMYNILWYSANNYDITLTHNWLGIPFVSSCLMLSIRNIKFSALK